MPALYTLRAADGSLYGPASPDHILQWIREGRILPSMSISPVTPSPSTPPAFIPLTDHPLFAPAFAATRYIPQPTHVPDPSPHIPLSSHALIAFVLALSAFFLCPLLPALIAFPLALKARRILHEKQRAEIPLAGRTLAHAALILALLAIPFGIMFVALLLWQLLP